MATSRRRSEHDLPEDVGGELVRYAAVMLDDAGSAEPNDATTRTEVEPTATPLYMAQMPDAGVEDVATEGLHMAQMPDAGARDAGTANGRELGDQLRLLRDDPDLRTHLGAASRAAYERRFSRDRALAAWDDVITSLRPES